MAASLRSKQFLPSPETSGQQPENLCRRRGDAMSFCGIRYAVSVTCLNVRNPAGSRPPSLKGGSSPDDRSESEGSGRAVKAQCDVSKLTQIKAKRMPERYPF